MKYIITFLLVFLVNGNGIYSQYWVQQGAGATNNMGYAIATDNSGNTYSTGYFSSSVTFDAITLFSTGPIDMFIVKTSSDGHISWAIHAGGTNVTEGLSIAADNTGNIAVTGYFYGSSTFGSQVLTSNGQQDVFIAKYDSNGNFLWADKAGGSLSEAGNKVAFDISGNILLTGEFSSSNFQAGSFNLSSISNSLDIFTAKYDGSGNCLWLKSGTSPHTDRGTQINSDAAGNIYVAGEFSDTIQFDQVHNNIMFNALFVIKYNSAGQEQWFRWMGSGNTVKMKGLCINAAGEIIILGNYTSSLTYFGFPSSFTLSNSYWNNYFVSKLNSSGDLLWSSTDGSDSPVSSECLAIKPNQEIVVGGTYQCRFDNFSNHYGQGVFCSLGYNDCFVASYDNSGTWLWSKCFGGTHNDYLFGLATDNVNNICTAGAFTGNITFPESNQNFLGYPFTISSSGFTYCSDNDYEGIAQYGNTGNSDVYIGKPIDPSREPLDFFQRTGGNCNRDFINFCIDYLCADSVSACDGMTLNSYTFTNLDFHPDFKYLWSTGDSTFLIGINQTGYYSVTITTADGCFSQQDTIFATIHPSPPVPTISDSKGINSHALNALPVYICNPDSVILNADIPPGCTFQWSTSLLNPFTAYTTDSYVIGVQDSFGCTSSNFIYVDFSNPLDTIIPAIRCIQDVDENDTVEICVGDPVGIFVYDSISNPLGITSICITAEDHIDWTVSDSTVTFTPVTTCSFASPNIFSNFPADGWYTMTAHLVRKNTCATDSFDLSISIYVILHPLPVNNLVINVTGNTFICPGQTTTLHVTGNAQNYNWSNGSSADSAVYSLPGPFSLGATSLVIDSFGCSNALQTAYYGIINSDPLPVVSPTPNSALICPFDSVLLTCTGTGNFLWQGSNGTVNSNLNSIYVTTPGFYYCIVDDGLCILNSNNLEVYQYNTPLIIVTGTDTICNNQPAVLQIIAGIGSVISWQPPFSGNSLTQTVTNPGTYNCIVTSCNINTPLSLTLPGSNPVASINYSNPLVFCDGDSVHLSASHASHYLWLPSGDTLPDFYATNTGRYFLNIYDSLNCPASDSVDVQVTPNFLQAPVTNDTTLCEGDIVVLSASGSSVIHWLDQNHNALSTGQNYNTGTVLQNTYFLIYSDSGGCKSAFDSAQVFVENCDTLKIPNVFTPGGDSFNDLFPGKGGNGKRFDIEIYNRWGNLVFNTKDILTGWDGRNNSGQKLSDGTYYYIISVKFINGKSQSFHGWVFLKREP